MYDFDAGRKAYARRLGLTFEKQHIELPPPDAPRSTNKRGIKKVTDYAGKLIGDNLEEVFAHTVKDASCTFISLSPATFLKELLHTDHAPNDLLAACTPELAKLAELAETRTAIHERIKNLDEIRALTDIPSPADEQEVRVARKRLAGIDFEQIGALLKIAGTAMMRERKQQLMNKYETLLSDMASTHHVRDLKGALHLYDIAITAVAAYDSSGDRVIINDELEYYLQRAARLADGTPATLRRLYEGMRNNFPHLQFPHMQVG